MIVALVVLTLLLFLGAFFVVLYAVYRVAFGSPSPGQNDIHRILKTDQYEEQREKMLYWIDELNRLPFEQVYITSYDGLQLAARYYHRKDGAPLDIAVHGYRGTALRDFCGGTPLSLKCGHNVLLVDQRAHSLSEGNTITFGIKERYDCLYWAHYAKERFGAETAVFLYGISMGATTVLMAAGLPQLPDTVKGVVADCPYSSPKAIIQKVCRDMHYPPRLTWPFVALAARLFGGFSPTADDAVRAVKRAKVPILLLHGEEDRFVPCGMSEEIQKARADRVARVTFPRAGHGLCYPIDGVRYEQTVCDFVKQCLG